MHVLGGGVLEHVVLCADSFVPMHHPSIFPRTIQFIPSAVPIPPAGLNSIYKDPSNPMNLRAMTTGHEAQRPDDMYIHLHQIIRAKFISKDLIKEKTKEKVLWSGVSEILRDL